MRNIHLLKKLFCYLGLIFALNFFWEISQMFLYQNHTSSVADFIFVHLRASLGDVLIFGIIHLLGILIFRKNTWFLKNTPGIYIFSAFTGCVLAVAIEKYALATNRWDYNDLMPIIPLLNVGLIPILQMILLPLLFLKLSNKSNCK